MTKDIVCLIKNLTGSSQDVIINTKDYGLSYVGDSFLLSNLRIPLLGLEQGLKNTLKKYETKNWKFNK